MEFNIDEFSKEGKSGVPEKVVLSYPKGSLGYALISALRAAEITGSKVGVEGMVESIFRGLTFPDKAMTATWQKIVHQHPMEKNGKGEQASSPKGAAK